jgi:hypothetical protein
VSVGTCAVQSWDNICEAQRIRSCLGSNSWLGRPRAIQEEVEQGELRRSDSIPIHANEPCITGASVGVVQRKPDGVRGVGDEAR